MPESKDPAFKLFGTTIPVPHEITVDREEEEEEEDDDDDEQEEKDESDKIATKTKERDQRPATSLELTEPPTTSPAKENPKPPSVGKDGDTEVKSEQSISQEKTLKKPDKILPCPRCNSQDTKFCYYNNYNVNQPRHFCKNCQRYWTAGGTMRNVPVGAGRRKSKNTPSHYRHIAVANAFQTGRTDQTESIYHPSLKPNGTILTFSSDPPLSESVASGLNLADKTAWNCNKSGFIRTEEQRVPVSCGENGDEKSSGSSVTASDPFEEGKGTNPQEPTIRNCRGFSPQVPSFTNPPWIHPYNSAQWRPPLLPPPPFCASTFPVPFYPTTGYWGCPIPGAWNGIPWLSPQPSSPNFGSGSSSNSLNLGKHSRDGNMLKQSNSEKEDTVRESDSERCLWIPKTLRIDDQGEAARSSIWATLGIKYDKADTNGGGGFFKSFDSKVEKKNSTAAETSPALHVNPAALSRSLNFHERS